MQFLGGLDRDLRDEVASLIDSARGAGPALRNAVAAEATHMAGVARGAMVGRRVGAYQLGEPLGEGGMGTVYAAERADAQYEAHVAVKVLRSLGTAQAIARFRDERQILAGLDHPGIVRLLDGGSTDDGVHYLVMERIEGVPITTYAREHQLSVQDRIALLRRVCSAVKYAHGKLVVHRDLKPSNILVDGDGAPRLLDFGIAKLLDPAGPEREAKTEAGVALLTLGYASPEQARGEPVTTATDVYSLGAVLYELLADRPPHEPSGVDALRIICEVDPPRPSTVAPGERRRTLVGDLDNIILMALNKDPARRYASIEQLDDDLGRHLDGLPVVARTPTLGYRTSKYVRRNRGKLAIAAMVATALTASAVYSSRQALRADEQSRRAQRRFEDVRKLADTLVFQIDDRVRDLKGSTAARELVVSSALEYLDRLASESAGDDELEHDLALAYMKIGDVQGSIAESNLGKAAAALVSYDKARAILERMEHASPDNIGIRRALATCMLGTGLVEISLGDVAKARTLIADAIRQSDALPQADRLEPKSLIRGYNYLMELEPDKHVSRTYVAPAVALAEQWHASDPSPESSYWLAISNEMKGFTLGLAADPDGAIAAFQRARSILGELVRDHPDDNRFERELWITGAVVSMYSAGIGGAEMWKPDTGDLATAESTMREVVAGFAGLAKRDPEDARTTADAAAVTGSFGAIVAMRDVTAALPIFDRALAIYADMPPKTREGWNNLQSEWFVHCEMSEVLARAGRRDPSVEQQRIGLEIAERVGKDFRDNATLEMCRFMVARARHALGDDAGALELLDADHASLEPRVSNAGSVISDRIGYVAVLVMLAALRGDQTCALADRAATVWRSWPEAKTPYTARRQAQLDEAVATCRH